MTLKWDGLTLLAQLSRNDRQFPTSIAGFGLIVYMSVQTSLARRTNKVNRQISKSMLLAHQKHWMTSQEDEAKQMG